MILWNEDQYKTIVKGISQVSYASLFTNGKIYGESYYSGKS